MRMKTNKYELEKINEYYSKIKSLKENFDNAFKTIRKIKYQIEKDITENKNEKYTRKQEEKGSIPLLCKNKFKD